MLDFEWHSSVKAAMILGCSLLILSCHQLRGQPDRHMTTIPDPKEIAGRWIIDPASLERMRTLETQYNLSKLNPGDHVMIFRSDGTCSFKSYSAFQSDAHYLSSEGVWKLKMEDTVGGSGILRAAVVVELRPQNSTYIFTQFWIVREKNELILWNYIGDPDYQRYADFRKVSQ